ncbi:sn-glycerol-3-phosphate-binding periplasmic protein UgpB precursor [Rhodobacteraceae bacterium SB2]|jgi:sn-glycerol 3-phosphate transport system substrate-binding protein|nr:ABC transporter substrate-binding protein [Paracoccaceae bacterium]OAH07856.1 sn-glycerol-3-phosphate-binding periplasmic protein UgpB precursor [Rhodobacteraceae bacterium SB2]|tara:strand:- start:974 stop:2260 length:1287 start_codon:yes stop_codon:yes gene_type:complete
MKTLKYLTTSCYAAAIIGLSAASTYAAELEFYFPVGVNAPAVETIQALTDEWAAQNPQHTVKAIYAGNYVETTTKALTAANAGKPPQVAVLLSIDLFTLIEEDVILPISDIANTPEDQKWIDGFYDGFMKDAEFEGKTYAIPFQRSTPVYYYNKDAFRAAGLDPESPPKTWDEMIKIGKALTVKDDNGNVTQWGTRIPTLGLGGAWLFGGLVVSKGDVLTTETGIEARIDTPATIASLEFLLDLSEQGVMAPGGISWGDTPKAFLEGQTASMWTSTGNLAFIEKNATFDWGVGFLPGGDGPGAPIGGGNFYIFSDTTDEEREAALDFIKFMTAPENAATWSIATGYVAPRPDAWETPEMKAYSERLPQALVALDQLQYAEREFATFQRAKVTQYLVDAIESVVTGNSEPAAALKIAQEGADAVLSDYQ